MNIELISALGLAIYALTFLFASSEALRGPREAFGELLDEVWPERTYKMEECRMCVGAWIAFGLFLALLPTPLIGWVDVFNFLPAYGLSYFLATQER